MAENDKFIGTIIISDERHIDLFKVHVYEKSIRFDPKFANGIASSDNISQEIFKIDNMWKTGKIGRDEIFPLMANIVGRYEPHLSNYYFGRSELDTKGRYVGKATVLSLESVSFEDRMKMYYFYLNGSGKMLTISKKEFEEHIPKVGVSGPYLDIFESKGASYFKYDTVDIKRHPKTCYVMTKDEAVKFAFCT